MAPIWLTLEVRPHIAKYIYLVGFAITAVASWLLRDYSQQALQHIPELRKCNTPDGTYENSCAGKGAVLRISFGNFLFFCLHFILLIGVRITTQARRLIHTGEGPWSCSQTAAQLSMSVLALQGATWPCTRSCCMTVVCCVASQDIMLLISVDTVKVRMNYMHACWLGLTKDAIAYFLPLR